MNKIKLNNHTHFKRLTPKVFLSGFFILTTFSNIQDSYTQDLKEKDSISTDVSAKKKEKQFPKSGTLASTSGGGSASSVGGFGDTPLSDEDQAAPIGGSVSREKNSWVAKVFNNSKDSVSGNYKVIQKGKNGATIKTDSFSVNLAPGKSTERSFTANPLSVSGSLDVVSWKSNKKKEEPKKEESEYTNSETQNNNTGSDTNG